MANRTMLSDSDLANLEKIVRDLKVDGRSEMKIKGYAHNFWLSHRQDPFGIVSLTTEAWVNAVVQYLTVLGYEIKKKD